MFRGLAAGSLVVRFVVFSLVSFGLDVVAFVRLLPPPLLLPLLGVAIFRCFLISYTFANCLVSNRYNFGSTDRKEGILTCTFMSTDTKLLSR